MNSDLEMLHGKVKFRLSRWREVAKAGGVITVSMDLYERQQFRANIQGDTCDIAPMSMTHIGGGAGISLNVDMLNEMAEDLNCIWAMNPMKRLYYFIPKELTGGQQ